MTTFPIIIVMVLYFTSIPIAFALLAAALAYFTFGDVGTPPDLILQKFITSTAAFPLLAKQNGTVLAIITQSETPLDDIADFVFNEKLGDFVDRL